MQEPGLSYPPHGCRVMTHTGSRTLPSLHRPGFVVYTQDMERCDSCQEETKENWSKLARGVLCFLCYLRGEADARFQKPKAA